MRAETFRVGCFPRGGGEQCDICAERVCELERHVSKSAESHDADFLTAADLPFSQRRIGRDPRAQKRRRSREIKFIRKSKHEILIDHDVFRISAVSHAAGVRIFAVVGEGRAAIAELFQTGLTIFADPIGVDQASDCGQVAFLKFFHAAADFNDSANDFMARHARISRPAPLVARNMNVGMANAAI